MITTCMLAKVKLALYTAKTLTNLLLVEGFTPYITMINDKPIFGSGSSEKSILVNLNKLKNGFSSTTSILSIHILCWIDC